MDFQSGEAAGRDNIANADIESLINVTPPPTDSIITLQTSNEDDVSSVPSNKKIKLSDETSEYSNLIAPMNQSPTLLHFTKDQNPILPSPQRLLDDENQRLAVNETEPNSFIANTSVNLNNSHYTSLEYIDHSSTLGSSHDVTPPRTDSIITLQTSNEDDVSSVPSNKKIKLSDETSEYTNLIAPMNQSPSLLHFAKDQNPMLQSPQRLLDDENQRLTVNETEPNSFIANTSGNLNNSGTSEYTNLSASMNQSLTSLHFAKDQNPMLQSLQPLLDDVNRLVAFIAKTSGNLNNAQTSEYTNLIASTKQSLTSLHFEKDQNPILESLQRLLDDESQRLAFIANFSGNLNNFHDMSLAYIDPRSTLGSSNNVTSPPTDTLKIFRISGENDDDNSVAFTKKIELSEETSEYTNATVSTPTQPQHHVDMGIVNISVTEQKEKEKEIAEEDEVTPQEDSADSISGSRHTNADSPVTPSPALNCTYKIDVEDVDNFLSDAKALLSRVCEITWKTPTVTETIQPSNVNVSPWTYTEESTADEFSIVRPRIGETNFGSTPLTTPNEQVRTQMNSEPNGVTTTETTCGMFAVPQMDVKKLAPSTKSGVRVCWSELINEDSESDNASDDGNADRTEKDSSGDYSQSVAVINSASLLAALEDVRRRYFADTLPAMASIQTIAKTKRKLFTPNVNYKKDDEQTNIPMTPGVIVDVKYVDDFEAIGEPILQPSPGANRATLEQATATPKMTTPTRTEDAFRTPQMTLPKTRVCNIEYIRNSLVHNYSFLGSLDTCVTRCFCHPAALQYRDNYHTKKEELANVLYNLYNETLFDNALNVPLIWNKNLRCSAGRTVIKGKEDLRCCIVELSVKVLTSPDRLRCTLIHELCHAATFVFNEEGGHGEAWRNWTRKANNAFPELPKIGVCHDYDIEYKYTYKCTQCAAETHRHSKSKKPDALCCTSCHGVIVVFSNKKNKAGVIISTPVREATGFAKFVQDHYTEYKRDNLKHGDIMKKLSIEFAAAKVTQQQ